MEDAMEMCEWFALCDREAEFLVSHPVLGEVPACRRCLEVVGMEVPA